MMKISVFKKHIALYGADLSRWPQHEIKPAIELMRRDAEAEKDFSAAEKLDQMLRHYPSVAVSANALAERIVRAARRGVPRARPAVLNPAYLFVPGGALLVAAILGFMIGFQGAAQNRETLMLYSVLYAQDRVLDSEEVS